MGYDPSEHYYVPGVPLEKSQLVAEIRNRGLKSVSAVFEELAGGREDPGSKVGLASLLKTLWPDEYDDERDARFINDRVHANIQKDGTFSVVPRIYAGVTTPDELMRIAQVAVKYNVPTVKITGGQRIDLLGIKKEDLPGVWKDLGMPSGHAYTKGVSHVQELRGHRLLPVRRRRLDCAGAEDRTPLPGCGVAAQDEAGDGRMSAQLFGGLREGPRRRGDRRRPVGDLPRGRRRRQRAQGGSALHGRARTTTCCKYMGRFIQYYREHGRYLERTYHFVERIGIDNLRKILVEDSLGICARLDAEIQKAVDAYVDPWQEAELPAYHAQFHEAELAYALEVAENNG